jgi:hypothetical protein
MINKTVTIKDVDGKEHTIEIDFRESKRIRDELNVYIVFTILEHKELCLEEMVR